MGVIIAQLKSLTNPRIPDFTKFVREFVCKFGRNSGRTDRYSNVFVSNKRRKKEIAFTLRIADVDRYSRLYGQRVYERVDLSVVSGGNDKRKT